MPTTSSPPSETPGGFDHTSFPDLIDKILDFADTAGLLVFRGASKTFQARIDAMLFKHIILDDGDRDASVLQADIVDADKVMTEKTRLVIRVPAPQGRLVIPWADMGSEARASASRALAHTRVVDYHCYCDVDKDPVLAAALRGVEVARRVFPCPEVIAAHTVVDYLDVSNMGYWTAKPAESGKAAAPCAVHIPAGVKRSVLNVLYPNRVGDWSHLSSCGDREGTQFVLKFSPRDTSPSLSKMHKHSVFVAEVARELGPWGFGMLGPLLTDLGSVMEKN